MSSMLAPCRPEGAALTFQDGGCMLKSPNRRKFLKSAVIAAGVGTGRAQSTDDPVMADDPTKAPGSPARAYGERSRFEKTVRTPSSQGTSSGAPLQDLNGVITPSSLHFERHHSGVPEIDPRRHRLMIHGMVDRPLVLTMDELKRFPSVSRIYVMECSGNGFRNKGAKTVQEAHGLVSCSEWTGVPLALL